MLEAEAAENIPYGYGYEAWTTLQKHSAKKHTMTATHLLLLVRLVGFCKKKKSTDHNKLSHRETLSLDETAISRRPSENEGCLLLFTGAIA